MQRIRIGKKAYNAGFRIRHIGEVLYTQVKNEFEAVVDKCQVTVYTDPAECTRIRHEVAIPVFDKRDARLENLTDETVDVYYSCILCQACFVRTECGCRNDLLIKIYAECLKKSAKELIWQFANFTDLTWLRKIKKAVKSLLFF